MTIIRLRRYQCKEKTTEHENDIVKTSFTSDMEGEQGGFNAQGGSTWGDAEGDCLSGIGGLQIEKKISEEFYSAISFHSSWSFFLGWLAVIGCLCSSICVYTLSKLMRNGPLFSA